MSSTPRTFDARHLQFARAVTAGIAAVMITFTADHSAPVGMSVFSGFAILTALLLFLGAWLVRPAPPKSLTVLLGVPYLLAGMVAGIGPLRTVNMFFALVVIWAFLAGAIELIAGLRGRRVAAAAGQVQRASDARDSVVVGAVGVLLGIALLFVPTHYFLSYYIAEAHRAFTLTGITIGVGIYGFYVAIVAVYLAIAGASPRKGAPAAASASVVAVDPASEQHSGGAA